MNKDTSMMKQTSLKTEAANVCEDIQMNNNAEKEGKKFGLHRDEINPQFRIPFIMTGYRKPNLKAVDCLHSAFIPTCNETVNFWSHFIALILFILKFYELFSTKYSIFDSATWPLLSAGIGICGFCLASSTAHMFNSMSSAAQHSCFFMDYAAISIYSVGVGQAFFYYCRPLKPEILPFTSEWPFTVASILTSISTTFLCCITRHRWHKFKYVIRTSSMVAPFFVNASPYIYRILMCQNGEDHVPMTSYWIFKIHCFFYLTSAIVNMLRFPERVFPGVFDLLGHSHHFLHVFTAIGASYQFDAIHFDMIARQSLLLEQPIKITLLNTIVPFLVSCFVNFGIAFVFGRTSGAKEYKNLKKT